VIGPADFSQIAACQRHRKAAQLFSAAFFAIFLQRVKVCPLSLQKRRKV
jgi:hypothetical protein